jgi:hypothetical protein
MASEIINYRGYELHLDVHGLGLKAGIWQHNMYFMRPDIPYCPDKSLRAQLIIAAKQPWTRSSSRHVRPIPDPFQPASSGSFRGTHSPSLVTHPGLQRRQIHRITISASGAAV